MICNYYLTYRCNCSCEFCGIWQEEELAHVKESPAETVEKNFADLRDLKVDFINFQGGEVLLRDDLERILRASKKFNFENAVYTNGLLYPERAESLRGLIDRLYISVDAPFEEEHNRIKGQECFNEAMESVRRAKSLKQNAAINFTVTRDSIQYLPEMVDLAAACDTALRINPVYDYGGLEGFEKISVDYILRFRNYKNVEINPAVMQMLRDNGNRIKSPVCRAIDSAVTVSPDDCLILPCFNKRQAQVPIDGKLKEVYNSSIVKGYKKLQGRLDFCEGCLNWNYLLPSIKRKIGRYYFLDLMDSLKRKGE